MTSAPGRVQLRRVRGWRLPPDTVRVDRATRWGNPFRCDDPADAVAAFRAWLAGDGESLVRIAGTARGFAVVGNNGPAARQRILRGLPKLRGRRLACWCSPDSPCHADVLRKVARALIAQIPEERLNDIVRFAADMVRDVTEGEQPKAGKVH